MENNNQYHQINTKITILRSDITKLKVDAIVNAANHSLQGGGGVDGAIHRAGGSAILEECRQIGGCDTGQAVITTGGKLPARHVIHTVGPIYQDGVHGESQQLKSCYQNSLELAQKNSVKTIAFPNISTGVYGYPKDEAVLIVKHAIQEYLLSHECFDELIFCCFDDENYRLYQAEFHRF